MKKLILTALLSIITVTPVFGLITFEGAGASLPAPFYDIIFNRYKQQTGITVNYTVSNSNDGLSRLANNQILFAGSDIPPNLIKTSENLLFIPAAIGGVSLIYNIPGISTLKLTPEIVSDIYLGKIKNWNDRAIRRHNQLIELPDLPIKPFYRLGSGTSTILSEYLSEADSNWQKKVGDLLDDKNIKGEQVTTNQDMLDKVKAVPGAFGYAGVAYVKKENIPQAAIRNKSGIFVFASSQSLQAAATASYGDNLINREGESVYPIAGLSWLVINRELRNNANSYSEAQAIADFLWWVSHDAQLYSDEIGFSALTPPYIKKSSNQIKRLLYDDILVL